MRFFLACLLLGVLPLPAADLVDYRQDENRTTLALSDGSAEIEWISTSSFCFRRRWSGSPERRERASKEPVSYELTDAGSSLVFRTKYVVVEIEKAGLRMRVSDGEGKLLMPESEVKKAGRTIVMERAVLPSERYYGLGMRTTQSLDIRGSVIHTGGGLLMSSEGYGLFHGARGSYLFDLGKTRRDLCRVELRESDELEYFFYYGPRPMGILEEHMRVRGPAGDITTEDVVNVDAARSRRDATTLPAPASRGWSALGDVIRSAGHAGLSGILFPALNLGFFAAETDAIHRRAAQLAALMPIVYRTGPERQGAETARVHREMAEKRRRWAPYLVTYVEEAYLRGSPVVRPLPAHFPDDASAAGFADQFMVGDEVLAAPVFDDNPVRRVYLPMGVWTELHNNAAHQGRRVVEVEAPPDAAPLLAKNGSIVPLARDGSTAPMELHYFPKLAAEFFLIEPDSGDYSQFHAAPAGEYFRLEIESLADRDYEWVVHHVEPVREVRRGSAVFSEVGKASLLRPGSWFYDGASRNLHVQVHAPAGDDVVVNIAFR